MRSKLPRVLLADDNELNRDLLRCQLSTFDLWVDSAAEGQSALRRLLAEPYDLVLLDLKMPLLCGRAVVRQLRAQAGPNQDTAVLAFTAQTLNTDYAALKADGFTDVLFKPLTEERLIGVVQQFCKTATQMENTAVDANATASPDDASANPTVSAARRLWLRLLDRTHGSPSLAQLLLTKLFDELPRQLQHVVDALNTDQRNQAAYLLHNLKGSAAYCGLPDIQKAADALERLLLTNISGTVDESAAYQRLALAIDALLIQREAVMSMAAQTISPTAPINPLPQSL